METKKTAKINETKSWFFDQILKKIDKHLARFVMKKARELKSIKLEMKKENSLLTSQKYEEITRLLEAIICQQNGKPEMDKFFKRYSLPRLNQKEIEHMNRPIKSTEIETLIKKLSTKRSPGHDSLYVNYIKHLEKS